MHTYPIIIIGGPTASGKSQLAFTLAKKYHGDVINADSIQLYQGTEILGAQPDHEALQEVPHHLYGIFPPSHTSSVADWTNLATETIHRCHKEGRLPIVTGGTGLYLKALIYGLSPIPSIPEKQLCNLRDRYASVPTKTLYQILAVCDPPLAIKLVPTDRQRIQRGIEVMETTGQSLLHYQRLPPIPAFPISSFLGFFLNPPRENLHTTCQRRFEQMLELGALEEVKHIRSHHLSPSLPAMKTLGLPQLQHYLDGEVTLEEAILQSIQATRQYAKRQITWFRHQLPLLSELNEENPEIREKTICHAVERFLADDNVYDS